MQCRGGRPGVGRELCEREVKALGGPPTQNPDRPRRRSLEVERKTLSWVPECPLNL